MKMVPRGIATDKESKMTKKSADDIWGLEYDWLARDSKGHIALFSTAGAGYPTTEFLRDTDAHDFAIKTIKNLPATTKARFFPEVAQGLVNDWRLVAERGLFAYDGDPNGGPYRLVAAPLVAAHVTDLPHTVVDIAIYLQDPIQFGTQLVMTEEMLRASDQEHDGVSLAR